MGSRFRLAGLVATVAVGAGVAGVFACRQVIGIDQYFNAPADAASDDGSTVCGLPYGTNTCAACAQANCCAESTNCAADPLLCAPYESCLGNCNGDPACRSRCTIDHPVPAQSAAPVSALSACLAARCETACGVTCGGFAGYLSEPDAAAGCQECFVQNSCAAARACGSLVDCDAYWRCYLACTTPDCQWACAAANDAGSALFRSLYSTFSSPICSQTCGYGSYWACAGRFKWPNAKSTTITLTTTVYDFLGGGVAEAGVTVCGFAGTPACPCPTMTNRAAAYGQTDPNGNLTLKFQQYLSPTGGGSTYCLQVTAQGYLDSFAIVEAPNTEPVASSNDSLVPKAWGIALQTASAQQYIDQTLVGTSYDPTVTPVVAASPFDCLGSPAVGVGISLGAGAATVPTDADAGANVVFGDAGAASGRTNSQGRVIFLNVPPDASMTLTATVPGVGTVSQTSVRTVANTLIEVAMPPMPKP